MLRIESGLSLQMTRTTTLTPPAPMLAHGLRFPWQPSYFKMLEFLASSEWPRALKPNRLYPSFHYMFIVLFHFVLQEWDIQAIV